MVIRCRQVTADDWQEWRDLRLRALRDAPEAFSSTLSEWQDAGESLWRDRLSSIAYNLIADVDQVPSGMASGAVTVGGAELMSFWVAPFARGRGVGDALLAAVVEWATSARYDTVSLGVRTANRHAIALYNRHGFFDAGPDEQDQKPGQPAERRMVLIIGGHRCSA
jgi:ribosomal protein S18 acetylase RimI-like enzyme